MQVFFVILGSLLLLNNCNSSHFKDPEQEPNIPLSHPSQNDTTQNLQNIYNAEKAVWEIRSYLTLTENNIDYMDLNNRNPQEKRIGAKRKDKQVYLGQGSGFFISPKLMVTNFHVINHINSSTQIIANRSYKNSPMFNKMKLLKVSALHDLALLESQKKTRYYLNISDLDIDSNQNPFFLLGYPGNRFIKTQVSYQGRQIQRQLLLFLKPAGLGQLKGSSGGPIINQQGKVAGVTHTGTDDLIIAISKTNLKEFLDGSHRNCRTERLSNEECIKREWAYLKESSDEATLKDISFEENYQKWVTKQSHFNNLIIANQQLNTAELNLIDLLNQTERHNTPEYQAEYSELRAIYDTAIQNYNLSVKRIKDLLL